MGSHGLPADELDPGLLLWDVRRNFRPGGLGEQLVTIQFVFPVLATKWHFYWLVIDAHEVDLCLSDPGRRVDVTVEAELRTLTEIWMADARSADALTDGRIALSSPTRLTRRIPAWFSLHPQFARVQLAR